jgi:hypothetical protein
MIYSISIGKPPDWKETGLEIELLQFCNLFSDQKEIDEDCPRYTGPKADQYARKKRTMIPDKVHRPVNHLGAYFPV